MLIFVMNNRLASYLDETFYLGNQHNRFCMTTQQILHDKFTTGSNGEKKTRTTLFLCTVCTALLYKGVQYACRSPSTFYNACEPLQGLGLYLSLELVTFGPEINSRGCHVRSYILATSAICLITVALSLIHPSIFDACMGQMSWIFSFKKYTKF